MCFTKITLIKRIGKFTLYQKVICPAIEFIFSDDFVSMVKEPVENEQNLYFNFKSALTSQLVPCVVGNSLKPFTFITSALTAMLVRTIVLIATLFMVELSFPQHLKAHTTL